jgi:hypothetical protein
MLTMRRAGFLVLAMMTLLTAALAAPSAGAGPGGETFVLDKSVRVTRPNAHWRFVLDPSQPMTVSLENKEAGLQILVNWVANKSRMESKPAAAVLESRLMRAANSAGRAFSFPSPTRVAGQTGSFFTVDHLVDDAIMHRTKYVVVARADKCLVVAISGGVVFLDRHKKEIDGIIASIAFLH